jgi:hypothetical protein
MKLFETANDDRESTRIKTRMDANKKYQPRRQGTYAASSAGAKYL